MSCAGLWEQHPLLCVFMWEFGFLCLFDSEFGSAGQPIISGCLVGFPLGGVPLAWSCLAGAVGWGCCPVPLLALRGWMDVGMFHSELSLLSFEAFGTGCVCGIREN